MGILDSIKKLFGGGQADAAQADTVDAPEAPAAPTMEAPADIDGSGDSTDAPEGSLDSVPPVA